MKTTDMSANIEAKNPSPAKTQQFLYCNRKHEAQLLSSSALPLNVQLCIFVQILHAEKILINYHHHHHHVLISTRQQ